MKPRTHEENRSEVCILCLKKPYLQPLSTTVVDIIEKHILPDVRTLSWYYPTKICRACSYDIFSYDLGRYDKIPIHKYKFNVKAVTRTTSSCSCEICIAARLSIAPKSKGKRGRPSSSGDTKQRNLNLCPSCFTEMAKGKRHKCSKTEAKRNLLDIILQSVPDTADPVVAAYMRDKPVDANGQVKLSNLHGQPSSWIAASSDSQGKRKPHLSVDDLYLIKKTCDLSTRRTLQLSSCLRGLDIEIAPNVASKITGLNQSLKSFFDIAQLPFSTNDSEEMVLKPVVYCNNVRGLVEHVRSKRGVDTASSFCKVGIDGGGGSLKVTISIIEEARNTEGESRTKCKDTGVKMLLLLAVAPGVPEKYVNLTKIWNDLLHLNEFSCFVAGDLKIINLLNGIMGHSSSHPCPYCISPKSNLLNLKSLPRTLEHVSKMSANWKSFGSQNKMAKEYYNCIEEPLVCGKPSDTIVSLCPPPALHITLGIVNTIYKKVEIIDADVANNWVKASGCQRHSKYGFTGRNCHKLIKNRDILETDGRMKLLKTALDQFSNVFKSCFQETLSENYVEKIENFSKTWIAADLPGTSKFHILKYHVEDFCGRTVAGLSKFGEQASETVHFDFNVTWNRVKAPEQSSCYTKQLLRAVVLYNSGHL